MSKILIIFLCFLVTANAKAYMLSTGTYVPYFNKVQVNNEGSTQKYDLNPYLGIGTYLQMSSSHYFLPEFGYSYFLDNSSGSRREMVFLHYNFGMVLTDQFLMRYGLSTHRYRIIGKGGTTTLRNGESSSEFVNPAGTVTSYFTTLNLGAEYTFMQKTKGIRFDLNMMSFSELENRAYNYLLSLNFYL